MTRLRTQAAINRQWAAMPFIPLIATQIAEPLSADFYLNATDEQWDAVMRARYGDDWENGQ